VNLEEFSFEKLQVYQKALDFIDFVYLITDKFPNSEQHGLTNNFRRAAQSVALNIGEGSGGSKAEFKKFLTISRRSVRECVVSITIAKRRSFINANDEKEARDKCIELSKMLSGLIRSLHLDS